MLDCASVGAASVLLEGIAVLIIPKEVASSVARGVVDVSLLNGETFSMHKSKLVFTLLLIAP